MAQSKKKKENTCILRGQIATLTEIWKKLIPTLTDDFEKFKTSAEKATADGVEIVQPKGLNEELHFNS